MFRITYVGFVRFTLLRRYDVVQVIDRQCESLKKADLLENLVHGFRPCTRRTKAYSAMSKAALDASSSCLLLAVCFSRGGSL